MKRRRCELILPASEYDGIPPTAFEDGNHKYVKGAKKHYLKLTKKTCSLCGSTATFVGIFKYRRHKRVERFCNEHAATFARVPIPQINEQLEKIDIPRWTNMKVKI
jgi:hypothetical protein